MLGKTDATSVGGAVRALRLIAPTPGQIAKVRGLVVEMALASALRGAPSGTIPVLGFLILGASRRRDLLRRGPRPPRPALLGAGLAVAVVLGLWQPWYGDESEVDRTRDWMPLAEFLGPRSPVPEDARGLEVRVDITSSRPSG